MPSTDSSKKNVDFELPPPAMLSLSTRRDLSPSAAFINDSKKDVQRPSSVASDGGVDPLSSPRITITHSISPGTRVDDPDSIQQPTEQLNPETYHHTGLYWFSPVYMVGSFLIGLAMAIGHHSYYASLSGDLVGNTDDQQWALRFVFTPSKFSIFQNWHYHI
jgi:hypothetical protein